MAVGGRPALSERFWDRFGHREALGGEFGIRAIIFLPQLVFRFRDDTQLREIGPGAEEGQFVGLWYARSK